jgi:hypothetical protein
MTQSHFLLINYLSTSFTCNFALNNKLHSQKACNVKMNTLLSGIMRFTQYICGCYCINTQPAATNPQLTAMSRDITNQLAAINTRLDSSDTQLDAINDAINKRLDSSDTQLDAINKRLDAINKQLDSTDTQITCLNASLLAPEGDNYSKLVTVRIESEERYLYGHGMIITKDNKLYLFSAAHVLMEIIQNNVFFVKWDNSIRVQITPSKLFIPKTYVSEGINDFGCIEIKETTPLQQMDFSREKLKMISKKVITSIVGKVVVGHGLFFIRGTVLSVITNKERMLIQAPSIPGCSGSPLFNNEKNIVALLHGVSKHRGKQGHSNGAEIQDDFSINVYADHVHAKIQLHCVREEFYNELFKAENIPLEISQRADQSLSSHRFDTEGCYYRIIENVERDISLNQIMQVLSEEVWNIEVNHDFVDMKDGWYIIHPN